MNVRRVQSSISGLQRDITNYEAFLSTVIKDKINTSKFVSNKPAQNVNPSSVHGRSVMPFVSDPSVKIPFPPKIKSLPQKTNTKPSNTTNRVLCKEVFENSNATVEVTVKTKRPNVGDNSRKRSRSSALTSGPEVDRSVAKDETQKQHSDPSKHKRDVQHGREGHSPLNHGSVPWAHILKDKKTVCMIHSSNPVDKAEASQKTLHGNRRSTRRSFKRRHKHLLPKDSMSSSVSGDSSDDEKTRNCISKSVQCCLSEIIPSSDKQKDMPLSKLSTEHNRGGGVGGSFSIFNPVRTLNFLVRELRGKLLKNDGGDNFQRIITDMEDALMRIPSEINVHEVDHNDIPTRDETATSRPKQVGFVPMKPPVTSLLKPVVVPKVKFTGQGSVREFEHFLPTLHEQQTSHTDLQSSKLVPSAREITPAPQIAKRELELKYASLELKCRQLELACDQLKKERDTLTAKTLSMEEEAVEMHSKERDYLTTISCLRSNLENMKKKVEEQSKVVADLTASNAQLKAENKVLPLFESEAIRAQPLKGSSKEDGMVQAQLHIMKLEHDKFEILMATKDKELEKLKKELRDIQAFASEQLINLKSFPTIPKAAHQIDSRKQTLINNKTKLDSLATEVSLFLRRPQTVESGKTEKQPIVSSPTSSVPSSVEICPSWKNISRISASDTDVNKLSSEEVYELAQTGKSNIKAGRLNSDIEGSRSFSLIKPGSPEFKSFLAASLSEDITAESRHESSITEPKTCKELKDELRNMFEEIKKQTRMGTGICLPSPPRQYSEMSEPGGMSQWSEISEVESIQNSLCFSSSSAELNNGKFDFSTSDLSSENKLEADG